MTEVDITKVGEKISRLRKEQGLTLKEMSEYTGLSVGFLSNLETGKTSPTLENLRMVTKVLEIDFLELLTSDKKRKTILPRNELKMSTQPNYNMKIEYIDFGFNVQNNTIITIEPGECEDAPFYRHLYSESGTVIEGELIVEVDSEVYVLKKYDSIYVPSKSKHRIYNKSDKQSISYWSYWKK